MAYIEAYSGTASTWTHWNSSFNTTSAMTTGTDVWYSWILNSTNAGTSTFMPAREVETDEQREQRAARELERQREWQAKLDEERRLRLEAEAKAEELLRDHLTPEQRDEYEKRKCFHLVTPEGRRYRIRRGRSRNVELMDEAGKVQRTYCAHPIAAVPDADTLLAQKLMLECDEPAFLRLANAS